MFAGNLIAKLGRRVELESNFTNHRDRFYPVLLVGAQANHLCSQYSVPLVIVIQLLQYSKLQVSHTLSTFRASLHCYRDGSRPLQQEGW